MVEAAGVEPASGKDQRGTSTCISPSGLGPFPSGYPAVRRPAGPPREKGPVDGLLKQPALTESWRLVHFHLFYEEWASARNPSLNSPVETVSPPHFGSVVLGRTGNIAPGFPGGQGTAGGVAFGAVVRSIQWS